jgi:protein-tyrosine-phosphatase
MAMNTSFNVLFLCTGNSARSILAEAILNSVGANRFRAYSAGSHPTGTVSSYALDILQRNRLATDNLRSKSWDEFATSDSPHLDFVITVCDNAAAEVCPIWPGQPITAHWGLPDPAAVSGSEDDKRRAFLTTFTALYHRLMIFVALPLDKLDHIALQQRLGSLSGEQPWDGQDRRQ